MSVRPVSSAPVAEIPCRLPPDANRPEAPETYVGIGGGGGRRRDVLLLWKTDLVPNGDGAAGSRREDEYLPRADSDRDIVDRGDVVDGDVVAVAERDRAGVELRVFGD